MELVTCDIELVYFIPYFDIYIEGYLNYIGGNLKVYVEMPFEMLFMHFRPDRKKLGIYSDGKS